MSKRGTGHSPSLGGSALRWSLAQLPAGPPPAPGCTWPPAPPPGQVCSLKNYSVWLPTLVCKRSVPGTRDLWGDQILVSPCESLGDSPRGPSFHWWAWQREQRPRPIVTTPLYDTHPLATPLFKPPKLQEAQTCKSWHPAVRSLRLLTFTLRRRRPLVPNGESRNPDSSSEPVVESLRTPPARVSPNSQEPCFSLLT